VWRCSCGWELNSGQVIAGEIGSGSFGYTALGEQVGMAQRTESVAPPGGVMLSASTARLVDGTAVLGEREIVHIKGAKEPVTAYRLLGIAEQHRPVGRAESTLVGRRWEMFAVEGLLDRAVEEHGAVGVVGPPGIGKSRLVREASAMAGSRGVEVFTAFWESHTNQVSFHAVARLLRAATGVEGLDGQAARDRVRARVPDADREDVALFDDLLGIAAPEVAPPTIDPDARRRRLTALVNATSLARETPAVYVVEDAHWIDEVSESMLADFFTVIPQTPSLVLITYRPEYQGALVRLHGAHTVALAPLSDSETAALITRLLGPNPSVRALGQTIAERAAGNPFFTEEIVRELSERGVLRWSQRVIDLADGDPSKGDFILGSPLARTLALRAIARYCLGQPGWRDDLRHGLAMARNHDPLAYTTVVGYVYNTGISLGVLRPDDRAMREIGTALRIAERSGNDLALTFARMALGVALVHSQAAADHEPGTETPSRRQRDAHAPTLLFVRSTHRRGVLGA
jgi:hypothetical protein